MLDLINNRYQLQRLINSTKHGNIYQAVDIESQQYAIVKFETLSNPLQSFENEQEFYNENYNMIGIPRILWMGIANSCSVLVMQRLGMSLAECFRACKQRFSTRTTLYLAQKILKLIEQLHARGYVYCNVEPSNFVMGCGSESEKVYLIDFGAVQRYLNPRTKQHIPYGKCDKLCGNTLYSSCHSHRGVKQTRRDDLESIGYMLLHFVLGTLPWQYLSSADLEHIKMSTTIRKLCDGLPVEFAQYMYHVRNLDFDAEPNYAYLKNIFKKLYMRILNSTSYEFDWTQRQLNDIKLDAEEVLQKSLKECTASGGDIK